MESYTGTWATGTGTGTCKKVTSRCCVTFTETRLLVFMYKFQCLALYAVRQFFDFQCLLNLR